MNDGSHLGPSDEELAAVVAKKHGDDLHWKRRSGHMSLRSHWRRSLTACVAALTSITIGGCSLMSQGPPELEFNRSEAFLRMDEAIAQTIEGLPDFPGFQDRTTLKLGCSEEGRESYEINYNFPEDTIDSDLVTKEYFRVLKEHWSSLGWEVHGERDDVDGNIADIQATRPDGVNVWYSNMLGQAVIHAQVACVEAEGEPVCGPPLGGVTPENDNTKYCTLETPDDSATETTDAIAPFGETQMTIAPFSADGNGREPSSSPPSV